MTNAPKRPWALLFLVSLGINLFLGGAMVTRWMSRRSPVGGDLRPIPVMRMRRALGPEAAPVVDRVMERHDGELAAKMRATRQARRRAFAALSAEPYDRDKAEAALAAFREALGAMHQSMDEALLDLASDLTPVQRKKLHEAMDEPRGRFGPGRGRGRRPGRRGGGPGATGIDESPPDEQPAPADTPE